MEGESTSSNAMEMPSKYWTQYKVKQELIDEATSSWPNVKEEPILQIKEECDTDGRLFEDYDYNASCNQFQIEHIELKEEEKELKWMSSEPALENVIVSAVYDTDFSREVNLMDDKRNSEQDDAFEKQEVVNSAQKEKSLVCIICKKTFYSNYSLKAHTHAVHDKLKRYGCDQCDFACYRRGQLNHHVKSVHEKLKRFKCAKCDYSSNEKGGLSRHILAVHEKLKESYCPNCDYACYHKNTLSQHIKSVHEKVKEFKCIHCDYSCSKNGNLLRHIKSIHEKLKEFKCSVCNAEFSQKEHLSKHMRTVHKELKDFI